MPRRRPRFRSRRAVLAWAAVVAVAILLGVVLGWLEHRDAQGPDGGAVDAAEATVVRVVDGDTLVVDLHGEQERVRLLNIDTPESVHPDREVECGGPEAAERLGELLQPGDSVVLEFDAETRDHYGRLLAAVFAEETFVNEQLAREGWAEPYYAAPNDRFLEDIQQAWEQAEAAGAGMFSPQLQCVPEPSG
ncbi:thermonuclease family protein [Nesterenkonia sp.]|uniref:thermonuclease family protein n=1 Tax=Nesterenkonia sp. TaxID=704201 RepID=UPI00262E2630|nr:thermonuclease family protein [Nesterenkonia sp.]